MIGCCVKKRQLSELDAFFCSEHCRTFRCFMCKIDKEICLQVAVPLCVSLSFQQIRNSLYDTSGRFEVKLCLGCNWYPTVKPFWKIHQFTCIFFCTFLHLEILIVLHWPFNRSGQQGRKKAVFLGACTVCLAFKMYLKVHIMWPVTAPLLLNTNQSGAGSTI